MQMRDIDHTHPHTDEPFETSFRRGQFVAADGGRDGDERTAAGVNGKSADDERKATMEELTHESSTEGATRTFERGTEGRDETV